MAISLAPDPLPLAELPDGQVIFETPPRARDRTDAHELPPFSLVAWMTGDVNDYALGHDARQVHEREPQP